MASINRFRGTPRATAGGQIQWVASFSNVAPDPDTDVGPTATLPTPVGLNVGDLCVVYCYYRGATQNWSVSTSGGQNWIPCATHRSTTQMVQAFFCRFNGTWSAAPVFTVGSGTETAIAVLHAFRGERGSDSQWALDQSPLLNSGAGTGFTITGTTPQSARTLSIALVASQDDNEYTLTTPGRWSVLGNKQYRSTGGTDAAMAFAQLAQNQATATGNLTLTQATLGADAGITMVLVFKEGLDFSLGRAQISRAPSRTAPRRRMFQSRPGGYTEEAVSGASTITPANGSSTTSTLTGRSTAAATPSTAAGTSTTATLTGRAIVSATISAAAGATTTSTLTGKATAAATTDVAAGVSTTATLAGRSTAQAAPATAAGTSTAGTLTGRSTARATVSTAAGTSTTGTLVPTSGASVIDPAAGVSTTATLTGRSTAQATPAAAAGASTAATLAGASTARATPSAAAGASTTATLTGAATARATASQADGQATTGTLAGSSTARATPAPAAGQSTTGTLVGDGLVSGQADVVPAAGSSTTATLVGRSTARATIDPAAGQSTTGTLAPRVTADAPARHGGSKGHTFLRAQAAAAHKALLNDDEEIMAAVAALLPLLLDEAA